MPRRVKDFIDISEYTSLDDLIRYLQTIRDNLPDGCEAELKIRGEKFRGLNVHDLPSYRAAAREPLPRVLLIVDEFQEFFVEEDRVAQESALLLDRLVRQGQPQRALDVLAPSLAVLPDDWLLNMTQAEALFADGRTADAGAAAERALGHASAQKRSEKG